MKLSDIPIDSVYLDVDSVPVVKLPSGDFISFDFSGASRPYLNQRKAEQEGDALTADDFIAWVTTGRHPFDDSLTP
jgi:hypothetical protein